jgi:hypothetical protein
MALLRTRPAVARLAPVAAAAGILVMASTGLGQATSEACPKHLFLVARSKNANVVAYDANPGPGGGLVKTEPVVAYWLLDGDENRREELSGFERERAYGVQGKPGHAPGTYSVAFKARPKFPLAIRAINGCPVAMTKIHGHTAILHRLFVKSKEGFGLPKIQYVEIFGEDPDTGAPLHEKLTP